MRPRELLVFCDEWGDSVADRVHARLDEAIGDAGEDADARRLPVALRAKALSADRGAQLMFVFDHGDRLAAGPESAERAAEFDALVNALCSVSPSVHLLVSSREDALPPSVLSRLKSPDTRVLRLAPEAASADRPAAPPAAPVEPKLQRDAVYASIADRLGRIADRPQEVPWGSEAAVGDWHAFAEAPTSSPNPIESAPPLRPPAGEPTPDAATSGADAPSELPPANGAPPFLPGAFAQLAARRRAQRRRRVSIALVAAGSLMAVLLATVLWQHRGAEGLPPLPTAQPAATGETSDAPSTADAGSPAATPTATVPASAPPPPAPAPVAEAVPSEAPAEREISARAGAPEGNAEEPLADELWREMSRHGVARLGVRSPADPLEALSAGRRLAVVPYDALRTLASARGTARTARIVAPLFTEELHVVVRADSPLTFVHQIAGRRIDFGPQPSARYQTTAAFFRQIFDRPPAAAEIRTDGLDAALSQLLDGGPVDAILLAQPQPSAWLSALPAAQRRRLKLLAVAPDDPSTRRALRSFLPATVSAPIGNGRAAVRSFAVMTFLVANPATPVGRDDTAAVAAQALCRSLPTMRRDGHPKWREVRPALRLPVPMDYDPGALAVSRACDLDADAPGARPTVAESGAANDNLPRGGKE